jgi:hypothetical protein
MLNKPPPEGVLSGPGGTQTRGFFSAMEKNAQEERENGV